MPLKRTPPKLTTPETSKKSLTEELTSTNKCESEPEMGEYDCEYENISQRSHKRRAIGTPPDSASNTSGVIKEMHTLFRSLSTQQDARFRELQAAMQKQNNEIKDSINFLSEKYDAIMVQIKTLENEKKQDKKTIAVLEEKVEFLEKKTCSATIEIRNVPPIKAAQSKVEKKEDLSKFISELGKVVKVELNDIDLRDVFRTKTQEYTKSTIIAEFQTALIKERVLSGIRYFNKGKKIEDKLHTGHFKFSGVNKPIYVSESLTKKTAKLYSHVREYAKSNNFVCWTFRGGIYLRVDENKRIQIKSEHDLAVIKSTA
jgi:hypothetical protein